MPIYQIASNWLFGQSLPCGPAALAFPILIPPDKLLVLHARPAPYAWFIFMLAGARRATALNAR